MPAPLSSPLPAVPQEQAGAGEAISAVDLCGHENAGGLLVWSSQKDQRSDVGEYHFDQKCSVDACLEGLFLRRHTGARIE